MPNDKFKLANLASNSVNDFLPKFLNFNNSGRVILHKPPNVSISAAFKQLIARTERSRSTNLLFSI